MTTGSPAWSWRHAFSQSALAPTTKHVLHTLGMFMNELGEGCYPSVSDICRYSGLDKKTVLKHLTVAREAGWIAVSQHGYRGQRWKRQEYVARWPERDLTAACPPEDEGEGGGAVPPPSGRGKAVESVPEGGGIEGSKVVEQVHQDKTSPDTNPKTSPAERGAQARDEDFREKDAGTEAGATGSDGRRERAALERRFWKMARNHPMSKGMPKDAWLAAWMKLSPGEQDEAEARYPHWLALLRQQGKKHVPALSTYFEQKLFAEVEEPREEVPSHVEARPFGPLWQAMRLKLLLAGPIEALPPPTAWQRRALEDGTLDREAWRRERLERHGWPRVNRMHDAARERRGVTVAAALEPLGEAMEPVPVDSDRFEEWRRLHAERGWPWLPDPGNQRVVYFPAGGPAALGEFEAAVNDSKASEAAE